MHDNGQHASTNAHWLTLNWITDSWVCITHVGQFQHNAFRILSPGIETIHKVMTSHWRDVLTVRIVGALTGSETNTSSGGVSREPSAAAYTTANTKVLSQSTSKTGRQKQVQRVWTQMEINYTNGAQVNYRSSFIFMPLIIQQSIWANQNNSPSIYKCNIYLWQALLRCRTGDM